MFEHGKGNIQLSPGRINPRRNTLRHTVIKLTRITDRILKQGKMTNNIQENPLKAII